MKEQAKDQILEKRADSCGRIIEKEHNHWKQAEKERARIQKMLNQLDQSVAPDIYSELSERQCLVISSSLPR